MAATLPVIDISPLYSGTTEDRRKVALELDQACRTWGFFYITGHGIGPERIKTLMEMSARFFALPQEEKLKIDITKSANHRGYGLYEAEQLDPSQPTDWKETFDMGLHLDSDHPSVKAGRKLRGPNRHPTALPGWTELLEKHYVDMQAVAMLMLQALALAIGTDESFFVDKFHEQLSVFRMIHYPALPQEKGRVVCGAHTDYGIITMLYQDPAGGLQVQNLEGEWMDAPYLPNSFVVNIGDMMAMWSNDRYKSTKHRVLNPGIERYSMPFFTEPNPDTIISCLPNCCDDAHPAKYPDVSVEDWMQKRFAETYAYERVGAKNASA